MYGNPGVPTQIETVAVGKLTDPPSQASSC
jgi:hypothetical protein